MEKEIKDLTEKFELDEETRGLIRDSVELAVKFYSRTRKRVFARGFMMGLLSAVAIQSVLTILVLLGK